MRMLLAALILSALASSDDAPQPMRAPTVPPPPPEPRPTPRPEALPPQLLAVPLPPQEPPRRQPTDAEIRARAKRDRRAAKRRAQVKL